MIDQYWNDEIVFHVAFISEMKVGNAIERRKFNRYFSFPMETDEAYAIQLIHQYLPNTIELIYIEEIGEMLSFKSIGI